MKGIEKSCKSLHFFFDISVQVARDQAQMLRSPGSGSGDWVVFGGIASSWTFCRSFGFAL